MKHREIQGLVHTWMQVNRVRMEDCCVVGDAAWVLAEVIPPTAPRGLKWYEVQCRELTICFRSATLRPVEAYQDLVRLGVGEEAPIFKVTICPTPVLSTLPLLNVGGIQVQVTPKLGKALQVRLDTHKWGIKAVTTFKAWKRTKDNWYPAFGEMQYVQIRDYVAQEHYRKEFAQNGYHWVELVYHLYLDGTSRIYAGGADDYSQIWVAPASSQAEMRGVWGILSAQDFLSKEDVAGLCRGIKGVSCG